MGHYTQMELALQTLAWAQLQLSWAQAIPPLGWFGRRRRLARKVEEARLRVNRIAWENTHGPGPCP